MSYAEVVIYAPDDPKRAFQRGRTDRLGRFAFCPHRPGVWRVVLSDGMGHRLTRELKIGQVGEPASPQAPLAGEIPFYLKILVGLSLIFGLCGLAIIARRTGTFPGRQD